mgnify:CR=1 FL=1
MSDFDPTPELSSLSEACEHWKEQEDTFGRVYYALLGTADFTYYSEIAEEANCSRNSARKHLDRLVEMGIARKQPGKEVPRYRRNDAYFQWRDAFRIATELEGQDIAERVRQLEKEATEYEKKYSSSDPAAISTSGEDHETAHERLKSISEWRSIQRELELYEFAFRLCMNDGTIIGR